MKKYVWLPCVFFLAGLSFYVYDGLQMNSWVVNLPNLAIYALIVLALSWALAKKEQLKRERENRS